MTAEPDKVDKRTTDLALKNLAALQKLFPGVVADGVLDAGRLGELVDLEVAGLKDGRERYGLMWAGKHEAVQSLLKPSRGTLVPDVENSVDFDAAVNVFIEGDNLEVLKLMQKAYNDQVKLIYIDPPYNTGNDFVYVDDFADGLHGYLEFTRQVDEEGKRTTANADLAGRRHSRWLSMMYPRVALARNLLRQDGVLLCSINDVEFHNLRHILDEVFGPENFVGTFVWNNDGNIEQTSSIKVNHEFIVAFARDTDKLSKPTVIDPNIGEESKLYNQQIENSITKNGPANPPSTVTLPAGFPAAELEFRVAARSDKQPHVLDDIVVVEGKVLAPARVRSGWSSRKLLDLFIDNGFVPIQDSEGKETWFAVTNTGAIYGYKRRSQDQGHVVTVLRNMGTTKASGSWMSREWGLDFDFPKPERLIQHLVAVFSGNQDLVMDFFAGSGTTAHAVAKQNACDGGDRRCISVNIPEATRAGSKARAAGFKRVSDMTWTRLRAVMDSVSGAKEQGLRSFALAGSNFSGPQAEALNDEPLQLNPETMVNAVIDPYAVAQEVFLKEGVRLDLPWEWSTACGADVVSCAGVCVLLTTDLSADLVREVVSINPRVLVFLEDGFEGRDSVKANAFYSCAQAKPTIIMKTV